MRRESFIIAITCSALNITMFAADDNRRPETEKVFWDTVTKSGKFIGGNLQLPTTPKNGIETRGLTNVETLIENGPSLNRIDLVFVGDGYRAEDLNSYEIHVNNALDAFFGIEPLQSYLPLFNVHRVDVISNETGVDNDPVNGIERDTAMNMKFWCNGIERLLCVDTSLAWSYANNVSSTDAILAVANSSMYGGAGYSWADIGTFAGANSAATDIAIHEIGHSLANLADEYDYGGDTTYTGPEPSERNASTYNSDQMASLGNKWSAWLGENSAPWDGLVDTYEGCMYSSYGIYRPSNNSMMRALNRPFNQPSAEAFIIEMYRIVDPLDEYTPHGVLNNDSDVFITPVDVGHPMEIHWYLDGVVQDLDGVLSFSIDSLDLSKGTYLLEATVVDPTDWVRDEIERNAVMKQTVSWVLDIEESTCPADVNGDGTVGVNDLLEVVAQWGECSGCSADVNNTGQVNIDDLLIVIGSWGVCS
jgi:hypothetical protein